MNEQRRLGHDIRNSMNAMRLHSQVLSLSDGDDLIESLDSIIVACDQLTAMMDIVDALPDNASEDPGS